MPGYQMCRAKAAQQWIDFVNGSGGYVAESCTAYAAWRVKFEAPGEGATFLAEIELCGTHEQRASTYEFYVRPVKLPSPT